MTKFYEQNYSSDEHKSTEKIPSIMKVWFHMSVYTKFCLFQQKSHLFEYIY